MTILVTGGAGFIGSHTCLVLLEQGYSVVVADDLSNSSREALRRVEQLTGKTIPFHHVDICDRPALSAVFDAHPVDCVIHFAGLKAVGESVQQPLRYYRTNLNATMTLLDVMEQRHVTKLVFSSSATVYSGDNAAPLGETARTGDCSNPYGWTKYIGERILTDAARANPALSVMLLRYFNPVGAHESGRIGESPRDIPNNLMPYVAQVAVGLREQVSVYGDDYPTPDGTGVRDYLHVMDLAEGHVAAIRYLCAHCGVEAVNLGTGTGYSVLDMIHAFEQACGHAIPYRITARRAGDLAEVYADPGKARRLLGWEAKRTLEDMCRDAWNWQQQNPNGYPEA